jgi:ribonuclease M5
MLKIKQVVIVEGKCDKNVLENIIDTVIIPVNGFGVYKNKKKLSMIHRYARANGAVILTDSDNAGRQIRNFLKDYLKDCQINHVYVPNLYEVEDTSAEILRNAFDRFVRCTNNVQCADDEQLITRERLFDDGLIGGVNSANRRGQLLKLMDLPENLSVTALLDMLNRCSDYYDYERLIDGIF